MARKDLSAALQSAVRARALISVDRPFDPYALAGYAVGIGSWLVLHLLNTDAMVLNGYTAVQTSDVRRFAWCAETDEGFLALAVRLRKLRPQVPKGVSLHSTMTLLQTASRRFPLVTIHSERSKRDREICWIGTPQRFTDTHLDMREITPAAHFETKHGRHSLASITKIDFGGG
ncbi:MAG: hypothetical protein ACJ78W_07245, partial [Myxococcales bacterium]